MNVDLVAVQVIQGDIGEADCDVLVNASNTGAWLGSGVSAAIRASCGVGFQQHISARLVERFGGDMAPGDVLVTDAGLHRRAKWVAHVAVMDFRPGHDDDAMPDLARIERGTRRLLELVEELPATSLSLAMVALGTGTGGLGVRDSARTSAGVLHDHLAARASSKLAAVTFIGWTVVDYVNMLDEVRQRFTIDMAALPDEVRRFLDEIER